jgi:succinate-semialdehyde dehydrogenase/glutarate-semialdehyde dehydrogenase
MDGSAVNRDEHLLREANFIAGAWRPADSGATFAVRDPATGAVIARVADGGASETHAAIEAASAAFPAFRALTARERARMLFALHDAILDHREGLAALLTAEQGKPLAESRGEIDLSAAYVRWFAEEATRAYGDVIPSPWASRRVMVTKEPIGVVGAITPWNFPASLVARKVAPALAAGCTVVLKPSEHTPLSGLAWGVLAEAAAIPAGVLNIVAGVDATAIGRELTFNPKVAKITFTGSTRVGMQLLADSARTLKRVSLELGGNAPFIVFDDADLDRAVSGAIAAKFRNSGQTCVCANRFYVQAGIHDAFVTRFVEAAAQLRLGPGAEPTTTQGPLINERAVANVETLVADALAKGGIVQTGGRRSRLGGTFYEPTVITGMTPDMLITKTEVFGPVAPVARFENEDQVFALANDTDYGLASYVFTRDLARAHRAVEALQTGIVGVNEGLVTTEVAPFGGVKHSGMGREGSKYGLEGYQEMKYACLGL